MPARKAMPMAAEPVAPPTSARSQTSLAESAAAKSERLSQSPGHETPGNALHEPLAEISVTAAKRAPAPAPGATDSAAALRAAAESGDLPRLRALLSEQIDLEARDAAGRTALLLAVLRNEAPSVDALLAAGADPNSAAADGTTPLEAAETAHETSIAAALRRAGAR
jgi:hypothetical protein